MTQLSLSFLGPWHVRLAEETAIRFKYDKVRALLVYLSVESARLHRRETLTDMLWPELPETAARNNLRQALASLREVIGDRYADHPYLLASRAAVQFNPESDYSLDLDEFTTLLDKVSKHVHRRAESCRVCLQSMQQAAALYRGSFLADFYLPDSTIFEEWATLKREWLHQQALGLLGRLAAYHEQRGQYDLALTYVWRQLELDLWREEAHRHAMRLYMLTGDREAALGQYEKCRRILSDEMGIEPDQETSALYDRIRQNEAGPISSKDPIHQNKEKDSFYALPARRPHNLPPQVTPFLGRETELARIGSLLDEPNCRLITLTGPGGVGKSRLALQAAAEQLDSYADGVYFVSLAPLQSPEMLPLTLSNAIGIELARDADPRAHLLAYLREKDMLLVLDSFEHLIESAGFLANLLKHAPDLVILVSSHQRLNLQGETVFPVEGLPLPGPEEAMEILHQNPAVQLFVQSAKRVRHNFSLTTENSFHIVRITTLTAGLPLAIELAAAWVRALSCQEIAEEIGSSIGFLVTDLTDIPERHRSLTAVFDHSWHLLAPEEQSIFGGLSVFQGGFSRQGGEAVAEATPALLANLVDKSLLRRNHSGRYEIHEMIRQYAQEKMSAAGKLKAARQRHAAYFKALAEEAEPKLLGPEQAAWIKRLRENIDNLRFALHSSLEERDAETAGRIAGAVWRFWQISGLVSEGRDWLERILKISDSSVPAAVRAGVYKAAGVMAWLQGDYAYSKTLFEASLSLYQQEKDRTGEATLFGNLGTLAIHRTDYQEARTLLENALAIRRELGDMWGIASSLNNLGALAGRQGDIQSAQACYQECLALFRDLGYVSGIAISLSNLGSAAGDLGDFDRAYRLHTESLGIRRELGDKPGVANSLSDLGLLAYQQDDLTQACTHFAESLRLLQEIGDKEHIIDCLEGLALVASAQNQTEKAVKIWGATEALREEMNAPMPPGSRVSYQKEIAAARSCMEPDNWTTAWEFGRRLSLDQTLLLAQQISSSTRAPMDLD